MSRMVRRLLYPNRGRRAQMVAHMPDVKITPLMGVEKIRQSPSLTVGTLIEKVEWRVAKGTGDKTPALQAPGTVTTRKGIPGFGESESLVVGNAKVGEQLTASRPVTEEISETDSKVEVSSIQAIYSTKPMLPLMGTEQIPHQKSLAVAELMANVQWQTPDRSDRSPAVEDKINWD